MLNAPLLGLRQSPHSFHHHHYHLAQEHIPRITRHGCQDEDPFTSVGDTKACMEQAFCPFFTFVV
jgi:hypothetical protein